MNAWLTEIITSGMLVGALATICLALVLLWAIEVDAANSQRDPIDTDKITHRGEDE